jgi:hypothetical protein
MLDVPDITNVFPPHSLNTTQTNNLAPTAEGMFIQNTACIGRMYYSGSRGLSIGSRVMLGEELYTTIYCAKGNVSGLTEWGKEDWIQNVNHPSSRRVEIAFRSPSFNAELAMENVYSFGFFRAIRHNMTSVRIGTGYDGVMVIEYNYDKEIVNATLKGEGEPEITATNRGAEGVITSSISVTAASDEKDLSIIIYAE